MVHTQLANALCGGVADAGVGVREVGDYMSVCMCVCAGVCVCVVMVGVCERSSMVVTDKK